MKTDRTPSPAARTRLDSTVRLLLHLRLLLTGVALLFLPRERIDVDILLIVCAFALLTWLAARYWNRLTPQLSQLPLLAAGDAFVAAVVLAVDGPDGPFFMATVLTTSIAGVLFSWRGLMAIAFCQVIFYYAALLSYTGLNGSMPANITFQVLLVHPLLYPIAGYVGSRLRAIFEELAAEQAARQLAERSAAAAEERARLARDMHDSVAKTLQGTAMAAQALPLWVARDPQRASSEASRIAKATELAVAEARELISDLRTNRPDADIATQIADIATDWANRSGIPVRVSLPNTSQGSSIKLMVIAAQEMVAILQEALTNIERHSKASTVKVALEAVDGHAVLRVIDDGTGFGPVSWDSRTQASQELPEPIGHYGLVGMHERAAHANGSLSITSASGKGTTIGVRMPMAAPEDSLGETYAHPMSGTDTSHNAKRSEQ
ncbi:two-component sensor histidine kinase [Nocardiopsis gilva YIM 90087]|uniref:Two-component sensor histidine kinase n=1 Tax=Nocardiopsis gilva YIM 90087 TaxID=1235441 RepID=A0A223SA72_9ACTN|nr:histidine kinase [Nocardiopsis gilva]ASU85024.1 two-component sensor histidine kinase [Nocardiopsis gilva YIM 90087]